MSICGVCGSALSGRQRVFCCRKCKDKKHNRLAQERLDVSPNRRAILDERLIKRRIKRGIPLSIPVKKVAKKGSGYVAKSGYKFLHKVGHPNANKQGSLAEHVYVMSEYLGRPIKKSECVHHKNGIRSDNRIENLELWSRTQPSGQRIQDKIEWCIEFLKQYGIEVR